MNTSNRRLHARAAGRKGDYASFPGGAAPIRNLSLGGALLRDNAPLSPGSPIRLQIHIGRDLVSCDGVVTRSDPKGMAVRFHELSSADRQSLGSAVAQMSTGAVTGANSFGPAPKAARSAPASRLRDMLLRRGLVTTDAFAAAVTQRSHGEPLAVTLVRLDTISENALVDCFREEYRLPVIDLVSAVPTPAALALVPYEAARQHGILPIGLAGSALTIAICDPSNLDGLDEVKFRSGCGLRITLAPVHSLLRAIDRSYGPLARAVGYER